MKTSLLISSAAILLGIAVFKIASSGEDRDSQIKNDSLTIQKSSRKPSGESGGSRPESNARSLADLRKGWDAILPARGHSLFDEKEMLAFLKTLNLRETEMLVGDLLSRGANKDATSRVIGRWGELDADGALAFLEEGDVETSLFKKHLVVGWAKGDARAAFAFLSESPIIDETSRNLVNLVGDIFQRKSVMQIMAKTDPKSALRILDEWSVGRFEAVALAGKFTNEERDIIFEALPDGQNWAKIADQLKNRIYRWDNSDGGIQQGPGAALFRRWASKSPNDSIAWFREHESENAEEQGTTIPQLINSWYREHPEVAAAWIDGQLADKAQNDIVEILDAQLYQFGGSHRTLEWGRHLSKDYARFNILKWAASRPIVYASGGSLISRGPPAYEMDPQLIRKHLPQYNLSTAQEREILEILRQRE